MSHTPDKNLLADSDTALARLGNKVGVDVWHTQTDTGSSLPKALGFLLPYATTRQMWPHEEVRPYDPALMTSLLKQAMAAYPEKSAVYEAAITQLKVF